MHVGLFAAPFFAFVITTIAMIALRPLAKTIDLVDRPGGRKTHHGNVPLVGGLAMFLGISAALGTYAVRGQEASTLIGAFALLVTIGLLDDRFVLSAFMRLTVHVVAAMALVAGTGAVIHTLGNPFGGQAIDLTGASGTVFTVLLITAAINAFNMLDGMDGLAGVSALIASIGLGLLAGLDGASGGELLVCMVLAGSICGFLLFNLPVRLNRRIRCFMGDAGSTLLGVAVAWLCIRVSQYAPTTAVRPVTVLWVVALPLFELFWTVIRRLVNRRSPIRADSEHCHHLLIRAGLTVRAAFLVMGTLELTFVLVGLMLHELRVPDALSFALLISAGVATVCLMYRAAWICQWVPIARRNRRHLGPARPILMGQIIVASNELPGAEEQAPPAAATLIDAPKVADMAAARARAEKGPGGLVH